MGHFVCGQRDSGVQNDGAEVVPTAGSDVLWQVFLWGKQGRLRHRLLPEEGRLRLMVLLNALFEAGYVGFSENGSGCG